MNTLVQVWTSVILNEQLPCNQFNQKYFRPTSALQLKLVASRTNE